MNAAVMHKQWTPERGKSALACISPSCANEEWVAVGMALHSEWPDELGLDLWDCWSSDGDNYRGRKDCKQRWKGFKAGGGRDMGYIYVAATANGWRDTSRLEPIDPAILQKQTAEREEKARRFKEEEEKRHAEAAKRASEIWSAAKPAPGDHPYLLRKKISPHSCRVGAWEVFDCETSQFRTVTERALLVPIKDRKGALWGLQAIFPEKDEKLGRDRDYLRGIKKAGNFSILGGDTKQHNGRPVFILGEGFGTGASVFEATEHRVFACMDSGNIPSVAREIRESKPEALIVIAADHDKDGAGERAAQKAVEAAGGRFVAYTMPKACPADFSDLWTADMKELIVEHIQDAIERAEMANPAAEQPAVFDAHGEDAGSTEVKQTQNVGAPVPVPPPTGAPKRRTVQVVPGELPAAVDQAEAALVEQCNDIFQRAGIIVRPVRALIDVADGQQVDGVRLSQVNKHHLAERLTGAAGWEKYDARAGDFVPIDCPVKIAETYLSRDGAWRLKALAGIIDAPTLRPDGSILDAEGFDNETGLLLLGGQSDFKAIPENPTKQDAQEALKRLLKLIVDFSFVSNHDRSVALSGIFTACIRRSLPSAPLHGFSAPTAGSGKSMLVDLASIIACGRQAAVMSQGRDEAEQEKRLASALLAGDQVITVDNATLPIDGDLLCQVLTQQSVRLRVLGASVLRTMPTNAAFFATGNGLLIQGDMTRRALLCSLDPQCERPEQRVFAANPKDVAEKNRATLLCDALTILRAFHIAGRPQGDGVVPLGSFEVWSQWVRGALLWLEQDDPVQTMEKARASDPKLEAIVAVMSQWREVVGVVDVSVKDVISKATEPKSRPDADSFSYRQSASVRHEFSHDDLREALLTVAGTGGAINSRSLGKWLAANKGRLIALPGKDGEKSGSFRFVQTTARHGVAIWKLEEVKKEA